MNLEENYQKNMEFLKKGWSQVYISVLNADIKDYELNITKSGEYNIAINKNNIYPARVDLSIQAQVNAFLAKPTMFFKKPTWNRDSEKDYYHDKLIKDLEYSSPYLKENRSFENYYENLDGFFPFLLMMGIGAGYHIEKLIKQSNGIKEILIVDESYEMLKISFHLMDWRPIFMYFKQKGYGLYFVIGKSPENISNAALNTMFRNLPYQFYLIPFYTHYKSEFFDNFKDKFLSKINLGFTGHGFYDDEIISLEHTIRNLNDKHPVYRYKTKLPKDSTVFLIGSGPSIDNDIKYIKEHKDKVVIISCGTALRVLNKNNITPDFHMEIERPTFMADIIKDYGSKEYLKNINMIGLNVIYHGVYDMFKSAKIYFRENDAGSSAVPDEIPKLNHCNPTVVNGALSFFSDIGFKNIFMFGTDMGFRNLENHHSKDTVYYETYKLKNMDLEKDTFYGNFNRNEQFLTTPILRWCMQRAENCIKDFKFIQKKNINYFNCSDGLHINGATPFHAKNIKINNSLSKEVMLNAINKSFDSDFEHLHQEIKEVYKSEIDLLNNNIDLIKNDIKSKKIETFKELFFLIARTFELVNKPNYNRESYLTRSILKGTIYHFYTAIYTHGIATSDKEEALKYVNESLEKLLEFLDEAKKRVESIKIK